MSLRLAHTRTCTRHSAVRGARPTLLTGWSLVAREEKTEANRQKHREDAAVPGVSRRGRDSARQEGTTETAAPHHLLPVSKVTLRLCTQNVTSIYDVIDSKIRHAF